jgi:hypothetical protein
LAGSRVSTTTVNAIRLFAETGNISSGTVHLYGVRK